MPTGQTAGATGGPDRARLAGELEMMASSFRALLAGLPDGALARPSLATKWTNGGLLTHAVASLELVPREIACARSGKGLYNYPSWFSGPVNYVMVRRSAKGATPESLGRRFDEAFKHAMTTLDGVNTDDWGKGANFWGEGFRDIEGLFSIQPAHFTEHSTQVLHAIGR